MKKGATRLSSRPFHFLPETYELDRTIHRRGSSAALEMPIRGVTATSESGTGSPDKIRSGDVISETP